MFDNGESIREILDGYKEAAHLLAPDVAAIPVIWMNHSWTDEAIRTLDAELRKITVRYAREMRWRAA
jgi:hypothetical protein